MDCRPFQGWVLSHPPLFTQNTVVSVHIFKLLAIIISNSYHKKELRNDTARGSTAGFGGTGVCVGVRFVSLPSGRARGFNGDEW